MQVPYHPSSLLLSLCLPTFSSFHISPFCFLYVLIYFLSVPPPQPLKPFFPQQTRLHQRLNFYLGFWGK